VAAVVVVGGLAGCPPNGQPDPGACPQASQSGRPDEIESFFEPVCTPWGCGTNSATVGDGVVFDRLDGSGMTEINSVKIESAAIDGHAVRLQVERDVLSAVPIDGSLPYTGTRLVGLTMKLTKTTKDGPLSYEVSIQKVSPDPQIDGPMLTYWAGDPDPIPSYLIAARPIDSNCKPYPICKIHPPAGEAIPAGLEHDALVFEGDEYDATTKTVTDTTTTTGEPSSIFNLACAGTAPAKMHLMRHTAAGGWTADGRVGSDGKPPYYTTVEERRAMLKMFTADYCGAGHSFTVDGQDLHYGDANHWYPETPSLDHSGGVIPSGTGSIEALWDDHGAVCLDEPRPARIPPDARSMGGDPVKRAVVMAACDGTPRQNLPRCTDPGGVLTQEPVPPWHVISVRLPDR
jgi:hypothetical protein